MRRYPDTHIWYGEHDGVATGKIREVAKGICALGQNMWWYLAETRGESGKRKPVNTWRNGHDGALLFINQTVEGRGIMILTMSAPRKYSERNFLIEHFEDADEDERVVHAVATQPPE